MNHKPRALVTVRHLITMSNIAISLIVLVVAVNADNSPNFSYYCSTAQPLGLVYFDHPTGKTQRLFKNPVGTMLMGPEGNVAIVTGKDSRIDNTVEVYKSGHLVISKTIKSSIDIVSWNRRTPVVKVANQLWGLNITNGIFTKLMADASYIRTYTSAAKAQVIIRDASDGVSVVITNGPGKSKRLYRPAGMGDWLVTGEHYVVIQLYAMSRGTIDTTVPSDLWIIDLQKNTSKIIQHAMHSPQITAGRRKNTVIIAEQVASNIKISELDLINGKLTPVSTLKDVGSRTSLVGLSPDKHWLVMTTGYDEAGPGELWMRNLQTGKSIKLMRNIYECLIID